MMEKSLDTLQSLLHEVEMDWRQTMGPTANPLDIALPLLDNTSVGLAHRQGEFNRLKHNIEQALRVAVNEHYEAFNESVGSYRDVVHAVANSRNVLSGIQNRIGEIEKHEHEDIGRIGSLNENYKVYNEMVEILVIIEKIKKAPGELEQALGEKSYGRAQQILQQVYDDAEEYSLWELPALHNLKEYFQAQEDQLFGILVEEIHNTIFSKRSFAQYNTVNDLLKSSSQNAGYSHIERFLVNAIDTDISQAASVNHSMVESFINDLTLDPSHPEHDDNDNEELTTLDESNPFNQIQQLMVIVNKLGKLTTMIDIVLQRFSSELVQLVNRVVEDTKLQHTKLVKVLNSLEVGPKIAQDNYSAVVLQDLFWNFFKKSLFLLQSVKVMTEIHLKFEMIDHFSTVNDTQPDVLGRFWTIVQKEAQHLILSYISNDSRLNPMLSKLTVTSSFNKASKNLFHFYNVQYDKAQTTQLKVVLQDLFPGFINSNDMTKIDSPYIEDNKFLKQSKIIPADVSNMRYILEPLLLFIQGSSLLLPPESADRPHKFFHEVMQREFLPLLEEKVLDYYHDDVEVIEALSLFEPETKVEMLIGEHQTTNVKLFDIFVQFKLFFNGLLFNLNTSLQFREEFMPVVFKVLTMFHDKVEEIFKELLTELINYLEPNKELIHALRNKLQITPHMTAQLNVVDFKNSTIRTYFETFHHSLRFLMDWFDNYLVRIIDLNKTDLNVSQVERLRKTWFFFQFSASNTQQLHDDPLDLNHTQKLILNDEMRFKYNEVVLEYKKLQRECDNVLRVYNEVGPVTVAR